MDYQDLNSGIRIFGEREPMMKAVQLYVKVLGHEQPFLALGPHKSFHGTILKDFLNIEGIPYAFELGESDFPRRKGKLYRAVGFSYVCTFHLDKNVLVLSGESEAYHKRTHIRHARDLHRRLPDFRIVSPHVSHE